jgi:hypothetical protein
MAKLTRKQRATIEKALRNAERASAYIHGKDIAVCRREHLATTALHYSRQSDAACLYEVERSYGSDLVGLQVAIETLSALLATDA